MKKLFALLGILLVFTLALSACAGPPQPPAPPKIDTGGGGDGDEDQPPADTGVDPDRPYAGETVTVFSACGEEQCAVFESTFAGFEERTGIDVVVEGSPDFEQLSVVRAEAGDPPEFYNFPQPGLMADMARDGLLVDLGSILDAGEVSAAFNQAYIDTGTVDGTLVGLWHGADVKSLVWYPKEDFEAMGFAIPETWDDLLALTAEIAGMGVTPWCIGIESASATGWPATDWIEDIMLRTTSPENYDAWTTGELAFDSPEVRNAFGIAGEIFFNPAYVVGGTTGILTTNFGDSPTGLFEPRTCYLHRQASFIPNFFPDSAELGVNVDYFYLPPIDEQYGKPVLGSGNLLSMGNDTPAAREVLRFFLTPESVEAEVKAGNALAVMNGVPNDWYPTSTALGFANILANADTYRFDGSDLMPAAVGQGSFWTGVTDWIGGEDLDTVLPAIDATWPE